MVSLDFQRWAQQLCQICQGIKVSNQKSDLKMNSNYFMTKWSVLCYPQQLSNLLFLLGSFRGNSWHSKETYLRILCGAHYKRTNWIIYLWDELPIVHTNTKKEITLMSELNILHSNEMENEVEITLRHLHSLPFSPKNKKPQLRHIVFDLNIKTQTLKLTQQLSNLLFLFASFRRNICGKLILKWNITENIRSCELFFQ